jgi:hypothetical protein
MDKGKALESVALQEFRTREIPAANIEFEANGRTYECDVVVLWGDYLFIIECKNFLLSECVPKKSYNFMLKLGEAVDQVNEAADALLAHPEFIKAKFGNGAAWKHVVRCVLIGMPWSAGMEINGVNIYDMSALRRFFESSHLRLISPIQLDENIRVLRRHGVARFWKGEDPTPVDLAEQMKLPLQLKLLLDEFETHDLISGLSQSLAFRTVVMNRKPSSMERYAKSLGLPPEKVQDVAKMLKSDADEIRKKWEAQKQAGASQGKADQQTGKSSETH